MDFQRLTDFLEGLSEKGIPGNSCAVMLDGKRVYEHYSGYADLEERKPVGPDTLFRIYSMTKIFTCVAAMQLYEKGLFSLSDPVAEYLPEFAEMRVLISKPNGKPLEYPAAQKIRVEDLFSMTAGLTYFDDGGEAARVRAENLRQLETEHPNYTTRDYARMLASGPLAFEPGSHWRYSSCHEALGAFIEVVSGERLSTYIEEHICRPLGLHDTYFRCDEETRSARLVRFYQRQADGSYQRITDQDRHYAPESRMDRGGAGLLSTLGDYLTFAQALTDGGISEEGIRIIGEETLRLMRTNRLNATQRQDFDWTHYLGYGYGLGVRVMMDPAIAGGGHVGEFGWSGMAGTWVMMDPVKRLTAVYMEQVAPSLEAYITPKLRNIIYSCL